MTPDNPFLQALLAEPEEDTLRLAMADWLDEHDQPGRAEFIRVQIELARGVDDRARKHEFELRQRDLLVAHDGEWVAPLAKVLDCKPGEWGGWVFRRGFVEYFHLPATVINKNGGRLAELTPVRELFLRPCNSTNVVALCRKPWLTSVTHLYLEGVKLTALAAVELLDCPYLANLRVLRYADADLTAVDAKRFKERFQSTLKAI
jgi:uncharacterized protein (TIGR02996 family)